MQAIATLVENDPYLTMPKHERIAARKARHLKLAEKIVSIVEAALTPVAEPVAEESWPERQKKIWFSVVDELGPVEPIRPTVEQIQRVVCRHFNIRRDELIGQRRFGPIVLPRHIAMYLTKFLTLRTLPEIGRRFGGRDHTSVLSAVRKIERMLKYNTDLTAEVEALKIKIAGAPA